MEKYEQNENIDDDENEEDDRLMDLLVDKEQLDTFLEKSKDYMQARITGMET